MPVTNYDTLHGEIIAEYTDGVQLDYLKDALGSVTAWVDQNCNIVATARYKPFGDILVSTGTLGRFTWVGTLGYRSSGLTWADKYVRARHYGSQQGQWTTVDPLWPKQIAYAYPPQPTTLVDPLGLNVAPRPGGLPGAFGCNSQSNELVTQICFDCYRQPGRSTPGCRARCNELSENYYRLCNKPMPPNGADWVPISGVGVVPWRTRPPGFPPPSEQPCYRVGPRPVNSANNCILIGGQMATPNSDGAPAFDQHACEGCCNNGLGGPVAACIARCDAFNTQVLDEIIQRLGRNHGIPIGFPLK